MKRKLIYALIIGTLSASSYQVVQATEVSETAEGYKAETVYNNPLQFKNSVVNLKVNTAFEGESNILNEEYIDAAKEWYSSNESVAKVDSYGNIYAVSKGQAEIKVKIAGTEIYSSYTVGVEEDMKTGGREDKG